MIYLVVGIFAAVGFATWLRPWPLFPMEKPAASIESQNAARLFRRWVEQQAYARGLNVRGVARRVEMECPRCRTASNHFVYPDELCERCWRADLRELSAQGAAKRIRTPLR